jgi:hypothetical protein
VVVYGKKPIDQYIDPSKQGLNPQEIAGEFVKGVFKKYRGHFAGGQCSLPESANDTRHFRPHCAYHWHIRHSIDRNP